MMAEFQLNDRQAEAILNMRLRSLRRLEEMELRRELEGLEAEREELVKLIESPARQKTRLKKELTALRKNYGEDTELGRRRTSLEEAGQAREISLEAFVEREPVTVIMSKRGWIKAMKGHADLSARADFKFKEGDGPAFAFHAQTTDKIAETRKGRGVVTLKPGTKLSVVRLAPAESTDEATLKDQYVAVVGDNRKLVVFPLSEIPEMAKGQGVTLQRYKDGGLADAVCFKMSEGLSWAMGGDSGRMRTENDMSLWRVARGAAGRLPPQGFPRNNRFD
jgi:topoisomerase-4 subunit A